MTHARESYGKERLTWVDRFGIWLSRRAILRWLPDRSNLSVLDVGCGYRAMHLTMLGERMERGVGIDFSIALEVKSRAKLEFLEGPVEQSLPQLRENSFDVVLMISVLEHLRDARAALARTYAVLKPAGRLLVNVPTWRGKWWLELSAFRLGLSPKEEMDDHKMYYDKRDLWPLLVEAGFKPSQLCLRYHKFGLNLFAVGTKT
jgi:ubiquinone/menaquinone biosynthesis C-methylase UbiE